MTEKSTDWPKEIQDYIVREQTHVGDRVEFRIGGEYIAATSDGDVQVPIRRYWQILDKSTGLAQEVVEYPDCPDCGEEIQWSENGHVPGTRKCSGCGSLFADTRYAAHGVFRDKNQ